MPIFISGHFRLFWHVLFDAAARYEETEESDREIIIMSPWISDVTTANSGWSETALVSAFDPHGGGNIESLSDVLERLVKIGYDVKVVTLSTVGKWLPKAIDRNLDNERVFMEKINKAGVECLVRNNLHLKCIKTPFCTLGGSVNISFNGLSGRTTEGAYYSVKSIHDQNYRQTKQHLGSTLIGAKDYFSPSIPITEWIIPEFGSFPNSSTPNLAGSEAIYAPLSSNEYPGNTAEGYLPQGQIGGNIGNEEHLSMIAQCSQLILRLGSWVLELISDEDYDGRTANDIMKIIFPNISDNQNNLDEGEILPDLKIMRELVLPNNSDERKYLLVRLGHKDNYEIWTIWSEMVKVVFDGLSKLSDKIHNGDYLTIEDSKDISKITKIFDQLS